MLADRGLVGMQNGLCNEQSAITLKLRDLDIILLPCRLDLLIKDSDWGPPMLYFGLATGYSSLLTNHG